MEEIHVHKTKKSICAHFAESPCTNTQHLHNETNVLPLGMHLKLHATQLSNGLKYKHSYYITLC